MTDYTTELLHISSYVIGILAGALLLAIALLFYYRRKLNKMCMMEDDFQPSDSENLFGKYATPIKESCTPDRNDSDNEDSDEDVSEEQEKELASAETENASFETEVAEPEAEAAEPDAKDVEEKPQEKSDKEEVPTTKPRVKRMTKAEIAEERLYKNITSTIVKEQLYLKPGFGRTDIVERFNISAHRAGIIFSKRQTSIPEFVRNCRLEHACQQMKDEPLANLSDIATASGFSFVSSFMRDFKDRYGMTPARFRETLQSNESETE
jgi:AraC-like DNA-binding protein